MRLSTFLQFATLITFSAAVFGAKEIIVEIVLDVVEDEFQASKRADAKKEFNEAMDKVAGLMQTPVSKI